MDNTLGTSRLLVSCNSEGCALKAAPWWLTSVTAALQLKLNEKRRGGDLIETLKNICMSVGLHTHTLPRHLVLVLDGATVTSAGNHVVYKDSRQQKVAPLSA